MTVRREVRSTPMDWAYRAKQTRAAIQHLSWCPPWVRQADAEDADAAGAYVADEGKVEDTGIGRAHTTPAEDR